MVSSRLLIRIHCLPSLTTLLGIIECPRLLIIFGVIPLKSKEIFKELLDIEEVGTPNYAMITHSYSRLCHHQKKYDEEKKYLMLSAIADIRNATRENASLQSLALIPYDEKNLADAFKFTQSAIDDVVSSGIHFRAIEIYKFNSIINTAYQAEQANHSHI